MVNSWLRPRTSSGLLSTSNHSDNSNDRLGARDDSSSSSGSSVVTVIARSPVLSATSEASSWTTVTTDSCSSITTADTTAPAPATATTATNPARLPSADNAPSLSTRRSTHEFFSSARETFHHHVASRPRPSSSYLVRSFVEGLHHTDSSTSSSFSNSTTSPSPTSQSLSQSQSQSIGEQPSSRFRQGISGARSKISFMARKALHNTSGSRDMRPIDRLSTHDSTLSTVIAEGSSSVPTRTYLPHEIPADGNPHHVGNGCFATRREPSPSPSPSANTFTPSPLLNATHPPRHAPFAIPNWGSRPPNKGVRRLRSLRERANPRTWRSSMRDASSFAQQHGSSSSSSGDADDEQPENDSQDVVMGNSPHFSQPWSALNAGSAARAAAAEHNHGKITNHPELLQQRLHQQHNDLDEEMSDDNRMVKKRRAGNGKFGSVAGEGDNGYDSMEIDNGLDEFTDRRRSKPPARTDLVGKLPTEIAAQILSYLDDTALARCAKVSRRWNVLAMAPAVWRSSFLGRYARAEDNVLPYIQFGGQGLGRRVNQSQEWQKMSRARRQIEKNWRAGHPKAVYFVGHTDSVYCCQFDEDKIITGSRDRTIRVWDLNAPYACRKVIGGPAARPVRPASDTPLETHPTNTVHQSTSLNGTPEGDAIYHVPEDYHTASILCLQFDKEIMVTGSSDHSCIVWDMNTFEPIRRLLHHTAGVLDVCMDDEYIISCSKDAHICVWDRKTYTLIKALHGHRGPVNAVQLREIGGRKLLVSASGDGLAKIWDLKKLEPVQQFNSQDRGLAAVEFSDDGKYVLAGGNDQVIYKFDSATTNLEHTFRGHSSLVRSLFLDSANARVVSGSYDQGIRVFDFHNGDLIGSYDNWTTSWILAAKGDYRRIVATSQDGRALLMDFGWGVDNADRLAGISMSAEAKEKALSFQANYGGPRTDLPVVDDGEA